MPISDEWARMQHARAAVARENLINALSPLSPNALDDQDVGRIGDFLLVVRNYKGNAETPIEECIISIVERYVECVKRNAGMTPDDIIHEVEYSDGCRSWFDTAVGIARMFRKRYAAVLDKADAEALEEAIDDKAEA